MCNLESTFDIVVGRDCLQKRFTVHTDVFTKRSEFFRATRSPRWLTDPTKPVDLEDDDPYVFSAYLNCVYFGVEGIKADLEDQSPPDPANNDARLNSALEDQAPPDPTTIDVDQQEVVEDQRPQENGGGTEEQVVYKDAFSWPQKECERRCPGSDEEPTAYDLACWNHLSNLAKAYLQIHEGDY